MILFEIQQGFVARGASISWLSQYPNEEEILWPPFTALEVGGTRVEGAVVIVGLRPSMKATGLIRTGEADLEQAARERQLVADERAAAGLAASEERRRHAATLAVKQRQAHWERSLSKVRLAASRRQASVLNTQLLRQQREDARVRCELATDAEEKAQLQERLASSESELERLETEMRVAESRLAQAAESEARALEAKRTAESRAGESAWKLTAMHSEAQLLRAVLRAKECVRIKQQAGADAASTADSRPGDGSDGATKAAAPMVGSRHSALVDEPAHRAFDPSADVEDVVAALAERVGPVEAWAVEGERPADMVACGQWCDRLAELCTSNKKHRKAAAAAGAFTTLAACLRRYESAQLHMNESMMLRVRCCIALAALGKKAEPERLQEAGQQCLVQLVAAIDTMTKPALQAVQGITRNHRENTIKLVRAGGSPAWLAKDSSVVPPDT